MIEERKRKGSDSSLAREQALQWAVRLQSGKLSESERQNLKDWLSKDPVHQQELECFTDILVKLDETPPLLAEEILQAEQYWEEHEPSISSTRQGNLLRWAQPCAIVGVIVLTLVSMLVWWPGMSVSVQSYETAKGEQQTIMLDDGSMIVMNTDSKLSVQMSDFERVVELHQGEALFTVAHDKQRPFEVHAGDGIIRDIGTKFLIHQSQKNIQVAVIEGIVEVGWKKGKGMPLSRPKELSAGEQVYYSDQSMMSSVEVFDSNAGMAWVEGKLIFVEKPLKEVLTEWARYRSETIELRDPGLGAIPISGVFHINNVGNFFQALEDALPIKPIHVGPQLVILKHESLS